MSFLLNMLEEVLVHERPSPERTAFLDILYSLDDAERGLARDEYEYFANICIESGIPISYDALKKIDPEIAMLFESSTAP